MSAASRPPVLLAGADLVLPDRVLPGASLLVEDGRIAAIAPGRLATPPGAERVDLAGCLVVPGFVDVHVHGVEGHDVLDGPGAIAAVASRLPRYGVTAFCPTSIACDPPTLERMLTEVAACGSRSAADAARVLPAHLESNFINPEYKGAQPAECLRTPPGARQAGPVAAAAMSAGRAAGEFTAGDILASIHAHRSAVGIVTLAPELPGGLALVTELASAGYRVSIGHTGASYDEALAAVEAGAAQATHLFNRMTPMRHRAPGVAGAVLRSDAIVAELICDGFHLHPAIMALAIRAKGVDRLLAITDGTAGSGLPVGSRTRLGGRPIVVTERTAELEDGTLAGSVLTMDGAFRALVHQVGVSPVEAARMCATTPAAQLGLQDVGRLAVGLNADLTVLDGALRVRATYLRGRPWGNPGRGPDV